MDDTTKALSGSHGDWLSGSGGKAQERTERE